MTGPDFVKARDLPSDPIDAQICFLLRLAIVRDLTPEEALELAQLQAAEQAQRQTQEVLQ